MAIVRLSFSLIILGLLIAPLATVSAQDLSKGWEAHQRGDYAEALRVYRLHAAKGVAEAQVQVGVMYRHGLGVPVDNAEAVRWYRMAANQRYADGQYRLGRMYEDGIGAPQDYAEAVRLFRLAAEQGDSDGQWSLATMYSDGRGVPQDYVLAHKWMNLAAAQGKFNAAKYRKLLESEMTAAQIAEAQKLAREWSARKR